MANKSEVMFNPNINRHNDFKTEMIGVAKRVDLKRPLNTRKNNFFANMYVEGCCYVW